MSVTVIMQAVSEFLYHGMTLCEVDDDLSLQLSHRNGVKKEFFAYSEYGRLFEACSPQCPLTEGVQQHVGRRMDENAQSVSFEGKA